MLESFKSKPSSFLRLQGYYKKCTLYFNQVLIIRCTSKNRLKDAVIYVDSDVLFIDSPQSLWNYFKEFNSQQVSKFYMA